jgi:PAS domain S-box-containing protein
MNYEGKTKDDLIKELHKLQQEFDSLKKIKNLKQEGETIRVLARFPSENPYPVLRVDRSGQLLFANEASYKFLTWKLQIGEKTPSVLQKIIEESLKEGIGKIIETEHNQRIFSFNIIPIVESGYANLYGRDITGLKQAEEALKIKKTLLRELFDNMKSGSAIFTVKNVGSKGSDYIVVMMNKSGLKMEGKALEEVVGKRLIDIWPTIDNYGLIPVMKKAWETGESAVLPTIIYIDECHSNYFENYVFKLPSGEVVIIYDDVTESKKAEETMNQQNNALSMLSSFSIALSMMSSEDSLEKFIVKRIKEFTGAEMATFSEYNPENRTLTIKHIEIKPGLLEKGVSLLGKKLDKIQFVVNDEMYREIITNPIGKMRTLFEVSFGVISQPVGATIKALFKADRFIAVAYIIEGKLYGTSVLAMRKDHPDPIKEILMNFIVLASASLRRKRAEVALLSTSRRLELALHSAKAGTWEWNIANDHMEWSPQIFDLLKLDSRTTVASIELWWTVTHPEDIEPTRSRVEQALKQRTMLNTDYRVILPDGQTCWINTLGEGVYDNQGRPISMIGISMNINGRKLNEEALHLEKENFRYSLDDSPLGVIIHSAKEKIIYANQTILNFYGYDSLRELQKTSIKKCYTSKSYAEAQKRKRQRKLGISINNYEISIVRKNGEIRHLLVFKKEILWNDIWQFQAIYEDVTLRKQGEEEIKNMKESMTKMHQHLDEIRENERALISREIHDQIGQSLTALKIDLSWLSGKIACDSEENAKLKRMIDLVDALSLDVHRISSELRPTILDDLGLASALEWYCEEFANRTGLKVKIEIEDVQTENMKKNLSIYRVAQELLTNIIRHAGAKEVLVILRKTNNDIIMSIQDDGIGISPDKVRSSKSLGFLGMFERVKQSAGNMEIKTPSEGGTSVRIRIPIK